MVIRRVFALWILSLLAFPSSAWAQRHGHAGYRSGHFSARHPGFHGRAQGFYGRPGQIYGFPTSRSNRFPSTFTYYRPYRQYHRRNFSVGPRVYPLVPFGYGIAPYPYYSAFGDPYWPGIGHSSRYLLGEERPRVTEPPRESRRATERIWLLALNDGSIRAVRDYWLEDNMLHYLTRDGKSSSFPLSELDLSFTLQLNRERGLDFRLPKPLAD
jgi:hypothetical protein